MHPDKLSFLMVNYLLIIFCTVFTKNSKGIFEILLILFSKKLFNFIQIPLIHGQEGSFLYFYEKQLQKFFSSSFLMIKHFGFIVSMFCFSLVVYFHQILNGRFQIRPFSLRSLIFISTNTLCGKIKKISRKKNSRKSWLVRFCDKENGNPPDFYRSDF